VTRNHGLSAKEQKSLERTLEKLDAVGTRWFLYGKEGRQMLDLAKRIRERLNPADPKKLEEEAARLLTILAGVPAVEEALDQLRPEVGAARAG
jgi:hypothetical protein